MVTDEEILEQAYNATVMVMLDFKPSDGLPAFQLENSNVDDLKSFCQGYFSAMFFRTANYFCNLNYRKPDQHPDPEKYSAYYVKICNHENLKKILEQ